MKWSRSISVLNTHQIIRRPGRAVLHSHKVYRVFSDRTKAQCQPVISRVCVPAPDLNSKSHSGFLPDLIHSLIWQGHAFLFPIHKRRLHVTAGKQPEDLGFGDDFDFCVY